MPGMLGRLLLLIPVALSTEADDDDQSLLGLGSLTKVNQVSKLTEDTNEETFPWPTLPTPPPEEKLCKRVDKLEIQINITQNLAIENKQEIKLINKNINEMKNDINEIKIDIGNTNRNLQKQVQDLSNKISNSQSSVQDQIAELKNQIAQSQSRMQEKLEKKIADLEKEMRQKLHATDTASGDMNQLKLVVANVNNTLLNFQNELKNLAVCAGCAGNGGTGLEPMLGAPSTTMARPSATSAHPSTTMAGPTATSRHPSTTAAPTTTMAAPTATSAHPDKWLKWTLSPSTTMASPTATSAVPDKWLKWHNSPTRSP